ncbi:RNA polymerase sigma factor [Ichthyenterobacterium magnum]|uniref:RNA polymerase sigma factor (Sigma-70 family) n=1 Tax=Ichthyenterobacterium magnum TaxID=1230530 RepID=A0A420DXQ3_9FLAO|nr:sigma-70 family RNA polymerase sigma factor [Ichthyenterobacterium magnum]RKE99014.1 RNA polymerase sigma factor (sigma-70 family) [Ichthyenterobacterium magnum]
MTDKAVIEALKKGDQNALKLIYESNRLAFIGFAKKYSINEDDVIDIYQDAIIALRENAIKGKIDNLKSELKTYLFSIGKYMIYERLKQQKKMRLVEDSSNYIKNKEIFSFNIKNELTDQQKQLHIAFKSLGQKCKDVLTLFYYRGFDLEDIMNELNYTNKDVVKSQKSRCIKSLKTMIFKN